MYYSECREKEIRGKYVHFHVELEQKEAGTTVKDLKK